MYVGDLTRLLEDHVASSFPRRIWVVGTVVAGAPTSGGYRFDLLESRQESEQVRIPCLLTDERRAALEDTLLRLHDSAVEDLLVDGHVLRAGGLLGYDTERQRVELAITALDVDTTRRYVEERREVARAGATEAGLAARQLALSVCTAPVRVAVVGPAGDQGVDEALDVLTDSGYRLEVSRYRPAMTGAHGADVLSAALSEAAGAGPDVVLLVRGPQRPLATASFDEQPVLQAVSRSSVPVLSGIGGGATVAGEVAYQRYDTPVTAAQAVVARLQLADEIRGRLLDDLERAAGAALSRALAALDSVRLDVDQAAASARVRAKAAAARRLLLVSVAAGVLVLLLGITAYLTASAQWLSGIVVAAAAVAVIRYGPRLTSSLRGRSNTMHDSATFGQALDRLAQIRRELDLTSSPEDVARLADEGRRLDDVCRSILRGSPAAAPGRPDH